MLSLIQFIGLILINKETSVICENDDQNKNVIGHLIGYVSHISVGNTAP